MSKTWERHWKEPDWIGPALVKPRAFTLGELNPEFSAASPSGAIHCQP
jgi:hypothetical protein